MASDRRVLVHESPEELASAVATRFIGRLSVTLDSRPSASVVLTGGRIGIAVLAAVNASPARDNIEWSRVDFWWGDERWLPKGDAERNDRQAFDALLDHIAVDPARLHPFPAADEFDDLDEAAAHYAQELRSAGEGEPLPRFDFLFLGVGPDGHIASLFPERPETRSSEGTVVAVRNSPKPPPERLSLTMPAITSAHRVWLTLAGADKASALGLALAGASSNEVPVSGAFGRDETVFFVDQAAAAEVPANLIAPE